MARTLVSALQALPEYSGWQEDEIKSDISNLFAKSEPDKISKFTTALSTSLPEFQGWGPDEVAGNIKKIFGLAPTLTPEAKAGLIGIENPDERVAAAVASVPPPGPAAEPTWREPGYQPKEQPIQPSPPPEPKLGIQPGAQPPAPPALEQPFVAKPEPAKLETPGEQAAPPPALLNQPSQETAETSIQKRQDSVWREAINAYKAGDKTAILDNMIIQAKYAGVDPEKIKEMAAKYEAEIEKIRPETHGAADFAATVIPGFLSDLGRMTSSGLKGALAAAPATALAASASGPFAEVTAPLYMGAGLNFGMAEYWRRKGEAQIYLQALKSGVDPKKADEISRYASIPYGLLANAQISKLLPKGIAEFISKNVSNRIAQNALSYGQHTLEASAIGASMQATSSIADELGKHLESGNAAPDVKTSALEVLKETKDAFLSAIPSMAVLALPGAVAHVAGTRAEAAPEAKAPPVENVNAEALRQGMLKDLEQRNPEAPKPAAQKGLMPPTVPLEEVTPKVEAAPPAKPIKFETPEADIDRLTGLPAQNISMDRIGAFKIDPNVEILYLDLDYLKATNDVFGHDVGNDVLRSVGKLIRENFGDALSYGRIGGEEFYVALPVGKDHTEQLKQFIQSVPEKVQIDENGIKHPVTMSGGMGRGTIESEGGQQRVYADKLLYEAKERGRNQIVVDKNGERQYIIGKEGLEKNYVDRYKLRVLEEGARALLEKPDISPSERTALEGTIQAVQARREGLIQGKAAGEGINNEPGKQSGITLGTAGAGPVGTVAPVAAVENAGRGRRSKGTGKTPPVLVPEPTVTPPPPPSGIPPIPAEKAPGPVEAPKAPPVEPEAAPAPVPPPEAPPVKPTPPPEAPQEAPLPVRTAVKGVFKKKPLPVDTAKADNYRKATDLGYRKRTPGEEMAVADIKDQTEAQKFNKIADDVVKAYENRDLWEPDRLGQIYKTWDESGFRNKIDDFDVIRKANGIADALKRDGYDSSGNTIAPSKLDAAGLSNEARDALRAQGKVGKDEWHQPETWAEMTDEERKAILKKETYTATEFQKEIERIKAARAKDEISVTKRAEETVAEAALGGISKRMATAASERAGLRLPEDIETAQAKAKQRREKLLKENPEGDLETGDISADEMNDFLRKINYGDAKDINYYSKGEKPAGEGPTVEKSPESVTGEWENTLKDYYGDNRPASVRMEIGKTKIDGSAWAEGEKGQISMAKDGSAVIRIRQDLPVSELRSTIVHDLVGHFGIPEIVASDKNIWNIIVKEFEKDKALYRSGERSDPRTKIFEDYKQEFADNYKAKGEYQANLQMLHEWIARQVEGFDRREFTGTNRTVYGLVRAAVKRLLGKLGIVDARDEILDDAIRTSVKRMRERKVEAPPRVPKEPGTDIIPHEEMGPGEGGIEFAIPNESKMDLSRRKISDTFQRMLRIQEAITGKKKGELPEELDVIMKNEIMPGKIKTAIKDFSDNYVEPLKRAIASAGLNLREIQMYLYARHAKERNLQMAKINPKFNEDIVFNGIRQKNPGSGMPDSLADDIMRYFNEKYKGRIPALENIARQVHRLNTFHEAFLIHNGLVKPEIVNAWRSVYRDYVPLKGFQEEALTARGLGPNEIKSLQDQYYGSGGGGKMKGISVLYKPKRATGRATMANVDEIIPNLILQTEKDILVAGKSEVGRTFLNLARKYKNDEIWRIIDNPPKMQYFNERAGRVVETIDPSFRTRDDILFVMENGQEHAIQILDEPLRRAIKNMSASKGDDIITKITYASAAFNRYLGATITRFSPKFVARNLTRDIQEAMINVSSEDSARLALNTLKNVPNAIRGMWQYARNKEAGEWKSVAEEASRAGMTVEFLDFRDVEAVQKRFEKDIRALQPNSFQSARKYILFATDFIKDGNTAVENGTRLAFYKTLRDKGISPERAAQKAKNLTVNFNRKGEWGSSINSLYIFANAAIQGNRRMLQVLNTTKGKMAVSALTTAGIVAAERNRQMAGEENYKKYDKYTRMKNWMWIFPGGTAITIPVPYNFGVFYGMGVLISDMMHGDMTPSEAIAATIANVWDSFNPLGQGDLGQTFTPTFARALVDIIKNKNYAGLPIKPADMPWDEWKPESEKYFKGVSTPSKWIAQKVNAAFGGGPYKKSGNMTDISPEILDYLAKSYTGGVGDFIMKSLSVGTNVAHGKLPELRQIPLETFVRKPIESADKGRFYATLNELQGINAEYQNLIENDPKSAAEFKAKNQNQLTAYNISSYKRGQLTNYNTMIKNAEKKGDKKRVEELNQKVISTIKEWEKGMDKYGIKNPTK